MTRHSLRSLTLAVLLATALAPPVAAGELAGISMPDTVRVGDQTLALNGMALRSRAIFKVYVAGLYLPEKTSDARRILTTDGARRLVMHWLRTVDAETICTGWQDGLAANIPDATAEVRKQFDTLCDWMSEARAGDRFVFIYVPDRGTTVEVKGQTKGTLPGKPFADALFASWIGAKPGPGEEFKQALLGG